MYCPYGSGSKEGGGTWRWTVCLSTSASPLPSTKARKRQNHVETCSRRELWLLPSQFQLLRWRLPRTLGQRNSCVINSSPAQRSPGRDWSIRGQNGLRQRREVWLGLGRLSAGEWGSPEPGREELGLTPSGLLVPGAPLHLRQLIVPGHRCVAVVTL